MTTSVDFSLGGKRWWADAGKAGIGGVGMYLLPEREAPAGAMVNSRRPKLTL
jgi:hypothetical protein